VVEKYSWFAIPDHHWSFFKHVTSGHQMSQNPIYHLKFKGTKAKLKTKDKLEKGRAMKQGRQHRARQHKEAWAKFEPDLAKYNRKKVE